MSYSRLTSRLCVLTIVSGYAVIAGPALGQSTSPMVTDPGSSVTLTVTFAAESDLGPISGVDSDSASVEGTALITLFPTDPPFTHCRVHSLAMSIGQIDLFYRFLPFFTLKATFTDLLIESTGPFDGTIDTAGYITFESSPLHVTGNAHMVSEALQIDDAMPIDAGSDAPMVAHLSADDETVVWDQFLIPPVTWIVPPELLPDSISALYLDVDTDTDGVILRGPYAPSTPGDTDADDDIDLFEYPALFDCFAGPDVAAGPLYGVFCSLFTFDSDNDVDLRDLAEFQNAFTGSM